jgi:archaellum component FlaC
MTVNFQQLVMESWDLKKKVGELERTCEMLRAENLKLKNDILHAGESMQDFLQAILEDANETAEEVKDAGSRSCEDLNRTTRQLRPAP